MMFWWTVLAIVSCCKATAQLGSSLDQALTQVVCDVVGDYPSYHVDLETTCDGRPHAISWSTDIKIDCTTILENVTLPCNDFLATGTAQLGFCH